jgi:hypothetical protein
MRAASIIPCTLALFWGAGCQGNGGAISVRWRIVDISTGSAFDPGQIKAPDGSCCLCRTSSACATVLTAQGPCENTWQIESVTVQLADAVTGVPVGTNLPSFACSDREKTTAFALPPGTFAISLAARNQIGDGMTVAAPVAVPPPVVRTIVKGEVVNLDVIEIGVNPLPLPGQETGVTF